MNITTSKLAFLVLLPALLLSSCKSAPTKPNVTENSSVIETKNGAMVVNTVTMVAIVKAINASTREVTLATSNGFKSTVVAGPNIVNFAQIKVGDQVTVKASEEFAVSLRKSGAPASVGAGAAIGVAPVGAMPGGMLARTVEVTAKITAIHVEKRDVTVQFADGSEKTLRVGTDVNLGAVVVGDSVTVQVAQSLAITMS